MNMSRFINLAAIFSLDLESQYKQLRFVIPQPLHLGQSLYVLLRVTPPGISGPPGPGPRPHFLQGPGPVPRFVLETSGPIGTLLM